MAMRTSTASIYITAKDQTQNALNSITGNIRGLGGAISSVIATAGGLALINQSLEKYASLNDFGNFGIGTDKALEYVDVLKLSDMEIGNVQKSFEDLSVKIAQGINDEKLSNTFKELGVDAKALKNESVDEVFDKIFKSLANAEDKTKALAQAKEIFGKNGINIFDASQEERAKRIIDRIRESKDEVKAASYGADELYKNFDEIGNIITNKISNSFAPILPIINAFLTTIIETNDELTKSKNKLEIINEAESFKKLANQVADFVNVLYDGFNRALKITEGLWQSFLVGVDVIKLVADSITRILIAPIRAFSSTVSDLYGSVQSALDGDFDKASNKLKNIFTLDEGNLPEIKRQFDKTLGDIAKRSESVRNTFSEAFLGDAKILIDKNKLNKNIDKYIKLTKEAIENKTNGDEGGRAGVGKAQKADITDLISSSLKDLERFIAVGQSDIDILQKYNQLAYDNNLKTVEEYYIEKEDLERKSYTLSNSLLKEQMAMIEMAYSSLPKGSKERNKLEEQHSDLQIKQKKQEEEYAFLVAENNQKFFKERVELANRNISAQKELLLIEEERINWDVARGDRDSFEANLKIVDVRKQILKTMEEEMKAIGARKDLTDKEKNAELEKAKLAYDKFKNDIDPIAVQINDSINGSFEGFFNNVLSGTKSVKDSFNDMFKDINSMILNMIAKNLGNQLMESLFGSKGGSSGGVGGFLSQVLGGGGTSGGGDFFGGFVGNLLSGSFATGGYAEAGKAYLVGERGPEYFFPGQSGYVANNRDSTRMAGGGSPIIVNFHGITNMNEFKQSESQIAQKLMGAVQKGQKIS